ncbi:protein FAM13A-like, partial [Tropilaelaps mercedesae]
MQVRLKSLLGSLQICREFERTCWQPCGRKRTFSDQEKQRPVLGASRRDSKDASAKDIQTQDQSSTHQVNQSSSSNTFSVSTESMEFIDKGSMESMAGGVT